MVGLRTSSRTAFSLISELPDNVHVHTYDINSRYCTMMDGAKDIKNLIPQPTTLSLLSQNQTTRHERHNTAKYYLITNQIHYFVC